MHKKILSVITAIFMLAGTMVSPEVTFAEDTATYNVENHLEVEAENLVYSPLVDKVELADASGGYALQRKTDGNLGSASDNDIVFNINIQSEGRYAFYVRLRTSGSYITYHSKIDGIPKSSYMSKVPTGEFVYFPIDSYYLLEGIHEIVFTYRHKGYYIDKLVISKLADDTMFSNGSYDYRLIEDNSYNLSYELPNVLKNKTHPRLILEKDKIGEVRQNLTHPQNIDRYQRLLEAANQNYSDCLLDTSKTNNDNHKYFDYIEANAFLYALNNTEENAKKAVDGIKDCLKTYRGTHASQDEVSRDGGNLVFRASLVYDWCYDYLSIDDKNYIINECLLLFTAGEHGRDGLHALNAYNSDHGEEYVLIKNMLGFAVATFDEIPYYFNNVYKRIVEEFVPSRNFRYEDSDFNQMGDNYGVFRSGADSFLKLILYNLDREDFITSNQSMQAYQLLYRKNPHGDFMRDGDCYSFPILREDYRSTTELSILFIQSLLSKDPYLKGEYLRVPLETNSLGDTGISDAMHLALNDVSVVPKQKNDLPLSKYFGDKSGVMVARTSWDDGINSNTMAVSMKVSEHNMGSHSHSDSGHFYIYYKGPLALDSGVYEPTSGNRGAHLNNYYRETVAHNSMLIGGKGQKEISGIDTYEKMLTNTQYGEVLGYDYGSDLNKPDYTYLKGDLTKAYDGAADEYTRSFMFFNFFDDVYPGALVVFDKITSANETDKKTYLLHSQNEPEISGNRVVIKNTTDYGYNGRLINETLLPQSGVNIDKISGYIVGDNDYTVGKSHVSGIGDESGNYRVEISSSESSKTEYYLNVLQVSENNDNIAAIPSELIETDGFYGVKIKDRIALFSKNRDRTKSDIEFDVEGDLNYKIAVCDLKEGTWNVYKDGALLSSVEVYENGGVARFDGGSGNYRLSYESSVATQKDLNILNNVRDNPDYISVYRKNERISADGHTTSGFVYLPSKPVISGNEIMMPVSYMADEFSATVSEEEDFIRVQKGSVALLAYKNSPILNLDGTIYLSSEKSFEKDGQWYVQASALGSILGYDTKYDSLAEVLYLTDSSAPQNTLNELGRSEEVLSNCIFTKAGIVTDSVGKSVMGNVKLYNYSGKEHTFKVYLAVYNEGTLVALNESDKDLVIGADDKILEFTTSELDYTKDNQVKLFVWKKDGITPALVNKSK